MKKILKLALALILSLSVCACSTTPKVDEVLTIDPSISGTFTGTSAGMQGPVTVEMTLEEGVITSVVVTESKESAHVTDVALERIPAQMVEHQTTEVDVVTGATLTSNALMRAAAAAAEEAGIDKAVLKQNAYHATAGEAETWETDVLVVGGGGAGFAAAISAAQEGAKVILVEKSSFFGGNTYMAGGAFNAVDTGAQSTRVITVAEKNTLDSYLALTNEDEALHFDLFPEWIPVLEALKEDINAHYEANKGKTAGVDMAGFDSINLHMWHIYTGGLRQMSDGRWVCSNIDLARTLAEHALESYNWAGSIGVTTASGEGASLSTVLGAMWPRTHSYAAGTPLVDALKAAADKEGVTYYTEIAAKSLITKDGAVVGAVCEKADGTQVTVNTTKGVVLASGGYCANPAMVKEYDEYWGDDLTASTLTTNVGTNKGDGIIMAQEVGADVVDLGVTQMMPSSSPIKGTMTDGMWGAAESQIWVDANGNRFVNEYAERDVLAKASLELDGGIFYIIFAGYMPQEDGTYAGLDTSSFFGSMLQGYEGHVWYGSTLAELAEVASTTPIGGVTANFTEESLRTTIEKYNSYVEAQHDPDFGKEVIAGAIDLEAFEENENYVLVISPRKSSLHHSMGGVVINTNAEVLNTEGNVIPGLWAAGEVTGGVHAGNRLGGNAVADIFTFGKIAGKNAGSAE
ncbi:MAG: FAD-dependent oxidoreductase [Erysipelotrichaceae bacterium]|nr:FAD-dependent oxidoreductase [Erysipelotrichaceae bacterium]